MNIILYGAFGRHNFGDLLFPHIIIKLLEMNNIYTHVNNNHEINKISNIFLCDILERDMTKYGGHYVKSISLLFDKNIDTECVILVGGETAYCDINCAVNMFDPEDTDENKKNIALIEEKIKSPIYLIDKNNIEKKIICIANSIGGISNIKDNNEIVAKKLSTYEYVSTRDSLNKNESYYNVPDCAILTKKLFNEKIMKLKYNFEFMKNKFIAIQINEAMLSNIDSEIFQNISNFLKIPIYFFAAGQAPGHDKISAYKKFINNDNIFIFDKDNIWEICSLIANAFIVIGTSLHVRILSFCYSNIRFTLKANGNINDKQYQFITKWDNIEDTYICPTDLLNSIKKYCKEGPYCSNNIFYKKDNLNSAVDEYMFNSKKWIEILKKRQNECI